MFASNTEEHQMGITGVSYECLTVIGMNWQHPSNLFYQAFLTAALSAAGAIIGGTIGGPAGAVAGAGVVIIVIIIKVIKISLHGTLTYQKLCNSRHHHVHQNGVILGKYEELQYSSCKHQPC